MTPDEQRSLDAKVHEARMVSAAEPNRIVPVVSVCEDSIVVGYYINGGCNCVTMIGLN